MKLFEMFIKNNLEYEDYYTETKLTVASNQEEAEAKAEIWMREEFGKDSGGFSAKEIIEVDGYKIAVG